VVYTSFLSGIVTFPILSQYYVDCYFLLSFFTPLICKSSLLRLSSSSFFDKHVCFVYDETFLTYTLYFEGNYDITILTDALCCEERVCVYEDLQSYFVLVSS